MVLNYSVYQINVIRNSDYRPIRFFKQSFSLLTLLLLVTSCSDHPDGTLPYPVDITDGKVGRLHTDVPFEASKINALLPGFDVLPFTAFENGHANPILRVMRQKRDVMLISPDTAQESIRRITVTHPDVTMGKQTVIGRTPQELVQIAIACDLSADGSFCQPADYPHIRLNLDPDTKRVKSIEWEAADAMH